MVDGQIDAAQQVLETREESGTVEAQSEVLMPTVEQPAPQPCAEGATQTETITPTPAPGRVAMQLANIPESLKARSQWAVIAINWDEEKKKYNKNPVSVVTGYGAKSNDPSTWGSFEAASALVEAGKTVVAYALAADETTADQLVVIDLDHCITAGVISEPAQQVVNLFADTYMERSVSGDGIHIFVTGQTGLNRKESLNVNGAPFAIEVFSSKQFIAMTGDLIAGGSSTVLHLQEKLTVLASMKLAVPATRLVRKRITPRSCSKLDMLEAVLSELDSSEYDQWFRFGIALKRWGIEENMEEPAWTLFDHWSQKTSESNYYEEVNRDQWDSWDVDGTDTPITIASIFDAAKQAGFDLRTVSSPENGKKGGRPAAPDHTEVAVGLWVALLDPSGIPGLRKTASGWFEYSGAGWVQKSEGEVKQRVVTLMQQRKEFCPHGSTSYVHAVLLQLSSFNFCGTEAPLGSWIQGKGIEPADHWMAFANGEAVNVLHLAELIAGKRRYEDDPQSIRRKKSAAFFSKNFVPYSVDSRATDSPRFTAYLNRIMPNRDDQRMLQQLAGLALSDLTHYEKMFFLTGSGANGKSVFADILSRLVGTQNVCSLELRQLSERYLAWPLIENKLNISHDLTFANSTAMSKVEGVLKQVVSGQSMNVERKFQDTFAGKCTARLLFITNTLPAFSDQSDALFRRTVIIPFLEKIPVEEQDQKLTQRIIETELPAIFNWAVHGLADLLMGGFYESPRSLAIKKRHFASCNREREFLHLSCAVDPEGFVSSNRLYMDYRLWCADNGYSPVGLSAFCSTVVTVYPAVTSKQKQIHGARTRGYEGLCYRGVSDETGLTTQVEPQVVLQEQGGAEETCSVG